MTVAPFPDALQAHRSIQLKLGLRLFYLKCNCLKEGSLFVLTCFFVVLRVLGYTQHLVLLLRGTLTLTFSLSHLMNICNISWDEQSLQAPPPALIH